MAKTKGIHFEGRIGAIVERGIAEILRIAREGAPARRGRKPGRKARKAPAPRGARRTGGRPRAAGPSEALVEQVLAFVKDHPGLRNEQIRKQLQLEAGPGSAALARLREAGRVRAEGSRRATTYTAV